MMYVVGIGKFVKSRHVGVDLSYDINATSSRTEIGLYYYIFPGLNELHRNALNIHILKTGGDGGIRRWRGS